MMMNFLDLSTASEEERRLIREILSDTSVVNITEPQQPQPRHNLATTNPNQTQKPTTTTTNYAQASRLVNQSNNSSAGSNRSGGNGANKNKSACANATTSNSNNAANRPVSLMVTGSQDLDRRPSTNRNHQAITKENINIINNNSGTNITNNSSTSPDSTSSINNINNNNNNNNNNNSNLHTMPSTSSMSNIHGMPPTGQQMPPIAGDINSVIGMDMASNQPPGYAMQPPPHVTAFGPPPPPPPPHVYSGPPIFHSYPFLIHYNLPPYVPYVVPQNSVVPTTRQQVPPQQTSQRPNSNDSNSQNNSSQNTSSRASHLNASNVNSSNSHHTHGGNHHHHHHMNHHHQNREHFSHLNMNNHSNSHPSQHHHQHPQQHQMHHPQRHPNEHLHPAHHHHHHHHHIQPHQINQNTTSHLQEPDKFSNSSNKSDPASTLNQNIKLKTSEKAINEVQNVSANSKQTVNATNNSSFNNVNHTTSNSDYKQEHHQSKKVLETELKNNSTTDSKPLNSESTLQGQDKPVKVNTSAKYGNHVKCANSASVKIQTNNVPTNSIDEADIKVQDSVVEAAISTNEINSNDANGCIIKSNSTFNNINMNECLIQRTLSKEIQPNPQDNQFLDGKQDLTNSEIVGIPRQIDRELTAKMSSDEGFDTQSSLNASKQSYESLTNTSDYPKSSPEHCNKLTSETAREQVESNYAELKEVPTTAPATNVWAQASPKLWADLFKREQIDLSQGTLIKEEGEHTAANNIVASAMYNSDEENKTKRTASSKVESNKVSGESVHSAPKEKRSQEAAKRALDKMAPRLAQKVNSINLKHSLPFLKPRGFINKGNGCYINATLQALIACPPFYNLMKEIGDLRGIRRENSCTPILDSFVELFLHFPPLDSSKKLKQQSNPQDQKLSINNLQAEAIEPLCIYNVLGSIKSECLKGAQEDAEEFLSSVLNGLHEEMIGLRDILHEPNSLSSHQDQDDSNNDMNNDDNVWRKVGLKNRSLPIRDVDIVNTRIQEIFGGFLFSMRIAGKDRCGYRSPFFDLQLDISGDKVKSVQDAIMSFTDTEIIHDFYCSKTKQKMDAQRRTSLDQLPPILILHLKQFVYSQDHGLKKLMKKIEYPINFELPDHCLYEKNYMDKNLKTSKSYKLLAVVYHDGNEAVKGHYITDVYHIGSSQWIRCDDSNLRVVPTPGIENPDSPGTPYLLFYRRLNTIRAQPGNYDNKKKY